MNNKFLDLWLHTMPADSTVSMAIHLMYNVFRRYFIYMTVLTCLLSFVSFFLALECPCRASPCIVVLSCDDALILGVHNPSP